MFLTPHAIVSLAAKFPAMTEASALAALENAVRLHKSFAGVPGRVPVGNDFLLFWSTEENLAIVAVVKQRTQAVMTFFPAWKFEGPDPEGFGALIFEKRGAEKVKVGQVTQRDIRRAMEARNVPIPPELAPSRFELSIRAHTPSGPKVARLCLVDCDLDQLLTEMESRKEQGIKKAQEREAIDAVMMAKVLGRNIPIREIVLIEALTHSGWLQEA